MIKPVNPRNIAAKSQEEERAASAFAIGAKCVTVARPEDQRYALVQSGWRYVQDAFPAGGLSDLAVPPGDKLNALKGNLSGRYSVLINDQWRIVFRWTDAGPEDVELLDDR